MTKKDEPPREGEHRLVVDENRVAKLAAMLPERPAGMGRPIGDRAAWKRLGEHPFVPGVILAAEKLATEPPTHLTDELYLLYSRKGTRVEYEKPFRFRTERLASMAVAECVEDRGRFLAAIERELTTILEEKTWVAPAHDGSLANFRGERIEVDLAASARAWALTTVEFWLGEKLAPTTRAAIRSEIRRRVLDPYFEVLRSGNPRDGWWWMTGDNNWNAVCHAGVLGAGFALLESREERARMLAGVEAGLPFFLNGFASDGYCFEGIGYWGYGFGAFVLLAETVREATRRQVNLYAADRVREIALYPPRLEILEGIYPTYADGTVGVRLSPWALDLIERRIGLGRPHWKTWPISRSPLAFGFGGAPYVVGIVGFDEREAEPPVPPTSWALRDFFPEATVLTVRPCPVSGSRFAASMAAGHNGVSHNHNDVGSFVVVEKGRALILDPGAEIYTRQTFGLNRYDGDFLSSWGHSVPLVDGSLQATGGEAKGVITEKSFSEAEDVFALDLKRAYPVPTLQRLDRGFVYRREGAGSFEVADRVEFSRPGKFSTALITASLWRRDATDRLLIWEQDAAIEVRINAGGKPFTVVEEAFKGKSFTGLVPKRIVIRLDEPVISATITVTVRPSAAPKER
ncbi:MAG: heparinase [Verrucomicrobiia bacterium]